jgi:hypothetical protein
MSFVMIMPDRKSAIMAKARETAREFFRMAKGLVMPEFLVPAFDAPAGAYGSGNIQIRAPRPLPDNVSLFDVGKLPSLLSPSRHLTDWSKSIEVDVPNGCNGNNGNKKRAPKEPDKTIPFTKAQKEVSSILSDPRAVHQYLAYQAARLCAGPRLSKAEARLIEQHTLHIVVGAGAEDYFFMPGESMKNICYGDPGRLPWMRRELAKLAGVNYTFFRQAFMFVSGLWKRMFGSIEQDPVNRPYFAHFFDPQRNPGHKGLELFSGQLYFQNARSRIVSYWNLAAKYYSEGDMPRSFTALGHLVHLVCDLHVPAHVHNDPHGSSVMLGGKDSFEKWTASADYPSLSRGKGESNASIWCAKPLNPPKPQTSWYRRTLKEKLANFVWKVASDTQRFRSVDAKGHPDPDGVFEPHQNCTGSLSPAECHYQAERLIPAAIQKSAQIIVNFVNYMEREGQPVRREPTPA